MNSSNSIVRLIAGSIILSGAIAMASTSIWYNFFKPAPEPHRAATQAAVDASAQDAVAKNAQAIAELMAKLQANPNDGKALTGLGQLFAETEDWARAEFFLNRAVSAEPGNPLAHSLLGMVQHQLGKFSDAAKTLENALLIDEDPTAMFNLALIYKYKLDAPQKAENLLRKILELPSSDKEIKNIVRQELEKPVATMPSS